MTQQFHQYYIALLYMQVSRTQMLSPCSIVTMFVLRSIRKSKKIIGGTIKNGHSRDAANNAQKKDKKKHTTYNQKGKQHLSDQIPGMN